MKVDVDGNVIGKEKHKRLIDAFIEDCKARIGRISRHLGVSKNRVPPKWMVYNGTPYKMDDMGVPLFLETSISSRVLCKFGVALRIAIECRQHFSDYV